MADVQLTEPELEALVAAFYARVRADAQLGPIFNNAIDDWPGHLRKLTAFWSSVMLASTGYNGQPMAAHLRHHNAITPAMFERWLSLWSETAHAMIAPAAAAALQEKAKRIAESLQLGINFHRERIAAAARPPQFAPDIQGEDT